MFYNTNSSTNFIYVLSCVSMKWFKFIVATTLAIECYVCSSETSEGCDEFDADSLDNATETGCASCGVRNPKSCLK